MSSYNDEKIKNISLIVARPRLYGPGNFQVFARYGPMAIATVLHNAGYGVRLYDKSITPELDLESIVKWSDLIGFSSKTGAITDVRDMVNQVRNLSGRQGKDIPILLGGEHASLAPEHSLDTIDVNYLIKGEGDSSIIGLVDALNQGIIRPDYIKGLGYKVDGNVYLNPRRDFVKDFGDVIPDLNLVHNLLPFFNSPKIKYFGSLWSLKNKSPLAISFQGSRGCPYACNFCPTVTDLHGRNYRMRSINSSMEYLRQHREQTGIKKVVFEDPLGVMDTPHFHEFFEKLKEANIGIEGTILARIEVYKNSELLKKMRDAGIENLSLGFESVNDRTLKEYNKNIDLAQIEKSVDMIHSHGFSITGLFIAGADSDTVSDVYAIGDFIKKYGIEKWRISPFCQTPEKKGQMLEQFRFFTWNQFDEFGKELSDYCTGDFVFYYPKNIKPSELQEAIVNVNHELGSNKNVMQHFFSTFPKRGLTSTLKRIATKLCYETVNKTIVEAEDYINILKEIEKGMYVDREDGFSQLLEDKVQERYDKLVSKEKTEEILYKKMLV
ncbi:B12-binding domain-containing radical SAM protein [Candidatus Pacearchaeota archaeon]|nr:B12-binding domain-containing radical SAM protein [Candidatus Pacearchaeota archaeon]